MFPMVTKINIHDKCIEVDIKKLSSNNYDEKEDDKTEKDQVDDGDKLKIVHFWRQDEVLYVLRGKRKEDVAAMEKESKENTEKMIAPESQTDVATERSGSEDDGIDRVKTAKTSKNSKNDTETKKKKKKKKKGKKEKMKNLCELYQITLNQENVINFNQKYNTNKNKIKNKNKNKKCDIPKKQLLSDINSLMNCKKVFIFDHDYIKPNCSYYDEKSQSLLIA